MREKTDTNGEGTPKRRQRDRTYSFLKHIKNVTFRQLHRGQVLLYEKASISASSPTHIHFLFNIIRACKMTSTYEFWIKMAIHKKKSPIHLDCYVDIFFPQIYGEQLMSVSSDNDKSGSQHFFFLPNRNFSPFVIWWICWPLNLSRAWGTFRQAHTVPSIILHPLIFPLSLLQPHIYKTLNNLSHK